MLPEIRWVAVSGQSPRGETLTHRVERRAELGTRGPLRKRRFRGLLGEMSGLAPRAAGLCGCGGRDTRCCLGREPRTQERGEIAFPSPLVVAEDHRGHFRGILPGVVGQPGEDILGQALQRNAAGPARGPVQPIAERQEPLERP